jgi:zinc-finger of transposase IS204/IS1001/IS1096/IS1165
MQIEASSVFCLPDGLEMTLMAVVGNLLTIHITATAQSRPRPLCAQGATHVRSYYTRLVADVPCAGRQVQLVLHVRKFRCDSVSCPRKIFAERLGPFIEAWARKTTSRRSVWQPAEKGARAWLIVWPSRRPQPPFFVASWPCLFPLSRQSLILASTILRCAVGEPTAQFWWT